VNALIRIVELEAEPSVFHMPSIPLLQQPIPYLFSHICVRVAVDIYMYLMLDTSATSKSPLRVFFFESLHKLCCGADVSRISVDKPTC
jgi:hypothetical protein